jgi:hypothetical protein
MADLVTVGQQADVVRLGHGLDTWQGSHEENLHRLFWTETCRDNRLDPVVRGKDRGLDRER